MKGLEFKDIQDIEGIAEIIEEIKDNYEILTEKEVEEKLLEGGI